MLAVLRAEHPSGSSPALRVSGAGAPFSCQNCPAGQPYRYFLFPHSEVTAPTDTTYNQVTLLLTSEQGIRVGVRETNGGSDPIGPDWEMYGLSSDFVPQDFTVSDHIRVLHQQLEAAGKIKHRIEQCPELHRPQALRVWSPEQGWRSVSVRPT